MDACDQVKQEQQEGVAHFFKSIAVKVAEDHMDVYMADPRKIKFLGIRRVEGIPWPYLQIEFETSIRFKDGSKHKKTETPNTRAAILKKTREVRLDFLFSMVNEDTKGKMEDLLVRWEETVD